MHKRAVDPTLLAVTSSFECGSRMTSHAYPKLRACSLATVPLLKENMTKTQVGNCVAIDAMTEQSKEDNLKHYLHPSLERAYFLTLLNVTAHLISMIVS